MDIKVEKSDFPDGNTGVLDLEKIPADCKIEDLKIDYEGLKRIEDYITTKINKIAANQDKLTFKDKMGLVNAIRRFTLNIYITSGVRALSEKMQREDFIEFSRAYGKVMTQEEKKVFGNILENTDFKIPTHLKIISLVTDLAKVLFVMPYYCYCRVIDLFKSK